MSVCLFVCLSRSWILSKQINASSVFSPSGSFSVQTSWQYSDGNSPNGDVQYAGGVDKNRDFRPVSGFVACCQRGDQLGVINTYGAMTAIGPWQLLLVVSDGVC